MFLMTSYASRQNSCDRLDMVEWFNELIKSKKFVYTLMDALQFLQDYWNLRMSKYGTSLLLLGVHGVRMEVGNRTGTSLKLNAIKL